MTPEAQQIAIAEACGWRHEYIHGNGVDDYVWVHPTNGKAYSEDSVVFPDYLNDLNAMHEAEKVLLDNGAINSQRRQYDGWLWGITAGRTISATAAQRAEAFLRTLNLWKP